MNKEAPPRWRARTGREVNCIYMLPHARAKCNCSLVAPAPDNHLIAPDTAAIADLARDLQHVARTGLARGLGPDDLLPGLWAYAHGARRCLHLLEAHHMALETVRMLRTRANAR